MKQPIIALVILLFGFGAQGQSSKNLLLYYSFSNTLYDQSGNHNDAINHGCSFVDDYMGSSDAALYVPGYKSSPQAYVEIPDVVDGEDEITISAMIKFMSYGINNYEEAFISFGTLYAGGNGATGIYYREYAHQVVFEIQTDEAPYTVTYPWDSAWDNHYQHFAVTYSKKNGTMQCFHNGQLVGEKTGLKGNIETYKNLAALGRHWWGNGNGVSTRMEFAIDEVKVYKMAFSKGQVHNLYRQATGGDTCFFTVTLYDTVTYYDTVHMSFCDSVRYITSYDTATIMVFDTIKVYDTVETRYDTVTITRYVYDTISVADTLIIDFNYMSVGGTQQGRLRVFPNPATQSVVVSTNQYLELGGYSIRIVSASGSEVYQSAINSSQTNIDVSNYPKGVYFFYLMDNKNISEVKKIVIK